MIFESTSASKIGIAAPPESPKMYSTPSRSRHLISASAPVWTLTGTAMGLLAAGLDLLGARAAGDDAGTGNLAF